MVGRGGAQTPAGDDPLPCSGSCSTSSSTAQSSLRAQSFASCINDKGKTERNKTPSATLATLYISTAPKPAQAGRQPVMELPKDQYNSYLVLAARGDQLPESKTVLSCRSYTPTPILRGRPGSQGHQRRKKINIIKRLFIPLEALTSRPLDLGPIVIRCIHIASSLAENI